MLTKQTLRLSKTSLKIIISLACFFNVHNSFFGLLRYDFVVINKGLHFMFLMKCFYLLLDLEKPENY